MRVSFIASIAACVALMTLNFSSVQQRGFPTTFSANLNSAVACPDNPENMNDCMALASVVNDKIKTGSRANIAKTAHPVKSQQDIESCKANLQKAKSECIDMAGSATQCEGLHDFSVTILWVTVHFNKKTDCLTTNDDIYQNDIASCNAAYSASVVKTCY